MVIASWGHHEYQGLEDKRNIITKETGSEGEDILCLLTKPNEMGLLNN